MDRARIVDPLGDERWSRFVAAHPLATSFHQTGWLRALANTYGYQPLILTSACTGQPLTNGVVFCQVRSRLTGRRLVSLPFSDHCDPLLDDGMSAGDLAAWIEGERERGAWKYVELRPMRPLGPGAEALSQGASFWLHMLSLEPSAEVLFRNLHKDSFQRKIRRAGREKLTCERGRSEEQLKEFYRLLIRTRRRQSTLPQPFAWYRNLADCMGSGLAIWLARKDGQAIAAILSLRHRDQMIYKYGCSDERQHALGAMPLLFWRLIEEAKSEGACQIDLGRTDLHHASLCAFKDRMGAQRRTLTYLRSPATVASSRTSLFDRPAFRVALAAMPLSLSPRLGQIFYRHFG